MSDTDHVILCTDSFFFFFFLCKLYTFLHVVPDFWIHARLYFVHDGKEPQSV